MPDIPAATQRTSPGPTDGLDLPTVAGYGIATNTGHDTTVTALASITEAFSDLDNFVTVSGTPAIVAGRLTGAATVRHMTELCTDSCKVTGTIGFVQLGTTRLVLCADEDMLTYYALEVEALTGPIYKLHIIKGSTANSVKGGFLSNLFALLFGVLSLLFPDLVKAASHTLLTALESDDEVAFWHDAPNSTLRVYINDVEVEELELEVPRGEIPHGPGYRWHGVASGVVLPAVSFTGYAAQDVAPS